METSTIENNRLIAEFMGLDLMSRTRDGWRPSVFNFHNSWDSLIPVINKVYISDQYLDYKFETSNIITNGGIEINTSNINTTYIQVVEFIKWYNENHVK